MWQGARRAGEHSHCVAHTRETSACLKVVKPACCLLVPLSTMSGTPVAICTPSFANLPAKVPVASPFGTYDTTYIARQSVKWACAATDRRVVGASGTCIALTPCGTWPALPCQLLVRGSVLVRGRRKGIRLCRLCHVAERPHHAGSLEARRGNTLDALAFQHIAHAPPELDLLRLHRVPAVRARVLLAVAGEARTEGGGRSE